MSHYVQEINKSNTQSFGRTHALYGATGTPVLDFSSGFQSQVGSPLFAYFADSNFMFIP